MQIHNTESWCRYVATKVRPILDGCWVSGLGHLDCCVGADRSVRTYKSVSLIWVGRPGASGGDGISDNGSSVWLNLVA